MSKIIIHMITQKIKLVQFKVPSVESMLAFGLMLVKIVIIYSLTLYKTAPHFMRDSEASTVHFSLFYYLIRYMNSVCSVIELQP